MEHGKRKHQQPDLLEAWPRPIELLWTPRRSSTTASARRQRSPLLSPLTRRPPNKWLVHPSRRLKAASISKKIQLYKRQITPTCSKCSTHHCVFRRVLPVSSSKPLLTLALAVIFCHLICRSHLFSIIKEACQFLSRAVLPIDAVNRSLCFNCPLKRKKFCFSTFDLIGWI
ncbi:uncharacterized protein LOC132196012 isoform X2 [Neocloeon triangulifer]|uniref:uncharacterized protein LOC132196012 isoform X2 n=1 Tax=Neocloeon triangulifer TaxID=2078957 RepID=UPI00286F3EAB|nr:uncharacterized protein LOC132196012 isoform X2 [Neocloeon triangulifer]